MKKRKGSLIIATCLLSVVLLIILMTMFNINRKNAELITVQSDREKAYQVAKIGLNKATEEIEKAIDDYYKKNGTHITWKELYELKQAKTPVDFTDNANKIDNEGYVSCEYSYENGKIQSTGSYGTSSKDKIKITLTANYIMDYMGIYSSGVYYIPRDKKEENDRANIVGLNAVYSQLTQSPMTPWINRYGNVSDILSIPMPKNGYLTYFNLSSNPISNYYLLYNNEFCISSDKTYGKTTESKNEKIKNSQYRDITSESSRCFIMDMVKSLNVAEQYKYDKGTDEEEIPHVFIANKDIDKDNKEPVNKLPIGRLKKLYLKHNMDKYYYDSIFDAVQDNLKEVNIDGNQIGKAIDTLPLAKDANGDITAVYKFDNKHIREKLNISESPLPEQNVTASIPTESFSDSDSKNNKNIYLLKGRNIIIIPIYATVVIDGDLILVPNERMPEDDKANYPVLFVTGNLVVNGSIKGIGTIFSMNSITINALPDVNVGFKKDAKYEKYKKYDENIEKNGAIIVHACNQVYISNTFSLSSDNSDANAITSSWVLTQDRNALSRVDSDSSVSNNSVANMFRNSDRGCPLEFLENSTLRPVGTSTILALEETLNSLPDYQPPKPTGSGGDSDAGSSGNKEYHPDVITDQGNDPRFHVPPTTTGTTTGN